MLELDYRLVGAGWSEARISDGSSSAHLTASYLGDALGELVGSVAAVVEGEPAARCSWDEEPGEYRWLLARRGERVSVCVLWFTDLWGAAPDDVGTVVFRTDQAIGELARVVLRAADEVRVRHGPEEYRRIWIEHDFPDGPVERLRRAVEHGGSAQG